MVHCVPSCPAGELFAQAPVKEYPGVAVETVSDSSRYFVLRIQDDNGEDVNLHTTPKPFMKLACLKALNPPESVWI